jgi:uracil phosphoribosyltransferase
MEIHNLSQQVSLLNHYIAELRDNTIQHDRMRFRTNLERIGQIMAYEISKTLPYNEASITTPLGIASTHLLEQQPVLAIILRAALPMYLGMLHYFDKADNAFISAYRKHHEDGSFDIELEYTACPTLDNRILIICDPMLATGASLVVTIKKLAKMGIPKQIHIVAAIASADGIEYVKQELPNATLWVAAIDPILNEKKYIVPGLGDAGDLAFGVKMQA